jgi:hypothetical protein
MSYHLKEIPKGILGEFSKIEEEFLEFLDAIDQDNILMALIELSDMLGAIEYYREKYNLIIPEDVAYVGNISNVIENMRGCLNVYKETKSLEHLHLLEANMYTWCSFFNISKERLKIMTDATQRAFKSGRRK